MTKITQNEFQARYHRVQRYLPSDGLQMSVEETEALCQSDTGNGDEQVQEVPSECGYNLGHRGQGCACVGVSEVLEKMAVLLQHVLAKDTAGGVDMRYRLLHDVVVAEQVFNWNKVQSVGFLVR